MKLSHKLFLIIVPLMLVIENFASASPIKISEKGFPIVQNTKPTPIYLNKQEESVVHIAATAFKNDVFSISDVSPNILGQNEAKNEYMIIAGTVENSKLIKALAKNNPLLTSQLKGKWEAFSIQIIKNPFKGVKKALVVCGSDNRGLAYGIFELSRMIGVSPMVWWADVRPEPKKEIFVKIDEVIQQSPSIKYRGIFLNDEDWGLQPWAAKNMDKDIKDIGPKTYEKVCELLLRLKGNYIWPAMHPSTKAFWYYKENPKVANRYGIILGASHCEPMLRNNVFEWSKNYENEYGEKPKEWRYDVNQQNIYKYWEDRVKGSANNEAVYTVGMRGIHDGDMPGPDSLPLKVKLLEKVITDQRNMLNHSFGSNKEIQQIFCPYKEVLDIYRNGLKLPDDITIVWSDDNHGYIRQLSNPEEQKRAGRSGIYYHLSYWGRPNDYLWLSSISPSLIAYEMQKAFQFGADRLWVFNVGDIKPAEAELQFALDLAWDVKKWTAENANEYTYAWAKETFGLNLASEISSIKNNYYLLNASGKPEHLFKVNFSDSEISERLKLCDKLEQQVQLAKSKIPQRLKDPYFELIEYPTKGAILMNRKILFAKLSLKLAKDGDTSALKYSEKAKDAYEQIIVLTEIYNKEIAGGKWDGMMNWHPRDQQAFKMPKVAILSDISENKKELILSEKEACILASDFSLNNTGDSKLVLIKGLGINEKALTVKPIKNEDTALNNAPYAQYSVKLKPGKYNLTVKALPTFAINDDLSMSYAIAIDNEKPQIVDLKTSADTPQWDTNVLRGYMSGETKCVINEPSHLSVIRIYFISPGFVMNQLEISDSKQ